MSNTNVFSNMSDTKTVIRFVKEIEKHPCLYDRNSENYMDRGFKQKTWIYIAKKTNSTVADCKDKWTKIRTAYIRTLRPIYVNGVPTYSRPYYLASHLKFVPRLKKHGARDAMDARGVRKIEYYPRTQETNETETNTEKGEESDESEHTISGSDDENYQRQVFVDEDNNSIDGSEVDGDADDDKGLIGYDNMVIDNKKTNATEENKIELKEAKNKHEQHNRKSELFCNENIESNPRKMFLFSLLPDIEDFNEQQMMSFRKEVIKLIDNVMYN